MAQPDDIKIRIETEGDTSGAEEVQSALRDTRSEAEKLKAQVQAELDVDVAKRRQAAREEAAALEEVARNTREVAAAQKIMLAVGALDRFQQVTAALRSQVEAGTDAARALEGVESSVDSVSSGLQAFVATGNPAVGVMASLAFGAGGLFRAYQDLARTLEELERHEQRWQDAMTTSAERRAQLVAAYRSESLAATLAADTLALERFNAEQGRARRLADARRGLEEAQAAAGGESRGDGALRGTSGAAERAAAELGAAEERIDLLANRLGSLQQQLVRLETSAGTPVAQVEAARAQVAAAEEEWRAAILDLDNLREVTSTNLRAAAIRAGQEVAGDQAAAVDALVRDAAAEMQRVAAERGGQLQADAAGAFEALEKLTSDAIPDIQQVEALRQIIQQFRGSQDSFYAGATAEFDAILHGLRSAAATMARQQTEIGQINQKLAALEAAAAR